MTKVTLFGLIVLVFLAGLLVGQATPAAVAAGSVPYKTVDGGIPPTDCVLVCKAYLEDEVTLVTYDAKDTPPTMQPTPTSMPTATPEPKPTRKPKDNNGFGNGSEEGCYKTHGKAACQDE